jgi:preprotein translocase subunit YajC
VLIPPVLISSAHAQAASGVGGDAGFMGLLPIVLMFVLLYFLMIRPQMKRSKEHKVMTDALAKGDEVIAAGGLVGRITKVGDAYINLEIAPNTEVQMQKASVQTLLPKGSIKALQ